MSLIYPLLNVLGETFGKTLDKFNFKFNNALPRQQMFLVFLAMAAGAILFVLYLGTPLPGLTAGLALLVIVMIALSFLQNYFEFRGIAAKDLSFREPFVGIQPLLASFLAYLLFPSERQVKFIVGIIAGAAILYFGNRGKDSKYAWDKGTAFILLGFAFDAMLANLYKFGLEALPPQWLYMFRVAGVFLLIVALGGLSFGKDQKKMALTGIAAGAFYLLGGLAQLYSILYLGLNFTILIMLLQPALVYLFSAVFLKEQLKLQRMITSLLLILLVLGIMVA